MLPDYKTCVARINRYLIIAYANKGWGTNLFDGFPDSTPNPGFRDFWQYKTGVENIGYNILDEEHISVTASKLRRFLIYWQMGRTGVASHNAMVNLLRGVRPHYYAIRNVELGQGRIPRYRRQLQALYRGLDGITNRVQYPTGRTSYIVGKSKALLVIWGQTPGFDSVTVNNFLRWTHRPAPLLLRHLHSGQRYYSPSEFYDIIVQLDEWISRWPANNNHRRFTHSLAHLCPNTPVGRLIDMIYNQ